MKKSIALFGAFVILSATIAFAVTEPTNTAGTGAFGTSYMKASSDGVLSYACTNVGTGVNFIAKLSANVNMSLQSMTDGSSYLAATYHNSGNKYYATSAGDSRIYMREITEAAGAAPAAPPTLGATINWAGWTAVK